jgi:molecular chaperone DnaK
MSSCVLGIDLGTTNSAAAYMDENGSVNIITNAQGSRLTPSVVYLGDEIVVGAPAIALEQFEPEKVIRSIKTYMGSSKNVNIDGKEWSPEEISSFILKQIKNDAEAYLGKTITKAVITAPAYFNSNGRQSIKTAGEMAGLDVIRVISEPTAAALAYGLDKDSSERIMVYDLGGGTFDVSVLKLFGNLYEVVSTAGDSHLGGDDFDKILMNMISERISASDTDIEFQSHLRNASESCKILLSSSEKSVAYIPY